MLHCFFKKKKKKEKEKGRTVENPRMNNGFVLRERVEALGQAVAHHRSLLNATLCPDVLQGKAA